MSAKTMTNICMIVYSYYPDDTRVRREAEALVEQGYSVDVICLKDDHEKQKEVINGVNTYRLHIQRQRKGKLNYLLTYFVFMMLSFFKINILELKKKYKIVHIHNMPDILVLSAIIQKIKGSRIILDLHDPTPEVYMTKYSLDSKHIIIKVLKLIENMCIWFSDLVLTPNIAFYDLFISRGCPENKINIIMNTPQDDIFFNDKDKVSVVNENLFDDNKFVIMFHGTIVERHGLDTAVEALMYLQKQLSDIVFLVFGAGDFVIPFLELRDKHNLQDIIHYYGHVSIETIVSLIPRIDVGLIPNKLSPFTDLNLPTRIFEYLCLGKPVIVPRTRGINDYFKEDEIYYFEPGNSYNLKDVILDVYNNPEKREKIIEKGKNVYRRHTWKKEQERFVKLVENLL